MLNQRTCKDGLSHKFRVTFVVCLLMTMLFVTIISFSPAKATTATQVNTSYGWAGYDRNQSIYLTTKIGSLNL